MQKWVKRLTLGSNGTNDQKKAMAWEAWAPRISRNEGTDEDRCCRLEEVCGRVFKRLAEEMQELKCAVQQLAQE